VLRGSHLLMPRRVKRFCFALWCDQNRRALSHRSLNNNCGDEKRSPWGFGFRFAFLLDGDSSPWVGVSVWVLILGMGDLVIVWCSLSEGSSDHTGFLRSILLERGNCLDSLTLQLRSPLVVRSIDIPELHSFKTAED